MIFKRLLVLLFVGNFIHLFSVTSVQDVPSLVSLDVKRIQTKQERWSAELDKRQWRRGMSYTVFGALGCGVLYYIIRLMCEKENTSTSLGLGTNISSAVTQDKKNDVVLSNYIAQWQERHTWRGLVKLGFCNGIERGVETGLALLVASFIMRAAHSSQSWFQQTFDRISGFHDEQLFVQVAQATLNNLFYSVKSWSSLIKAMQSTPEEERTLHLHLAYIVMLDVRAFVDACESSCAFVLAAAQMVNNQDQRQALERSVSRLVLFVDECMQHQRALFATLCQQTSAESKSLDERTVTKTVTPIVVMLHSMHDELMRFFQSTGMALYDIDFSELVNQRDSATA